ncbi:AF4/FMR2 family member lilliputian isoform X1 [Rhynchophorus ferrugineus]|uniref:AF4/FMR2 family member lilliputian isoform X1 n=2 Tax=Rhynchophorus ferrugineus TaxID=354439 RepID=UPI003FCE0AAC
MLRTFDRNPLLKENKCREDRFRAREWERQARAAQMSSSAVDQDGTQSEFLFKEPVKVSPSSKDRVSHAIHNTLGPYDHVRNYLDKDSSGLIGVDGVPPSPAPAVHYSPPFNGSTASRLQASPDARHEFKKPHQQMHPPPLTHQRGGYVKPTEGKPPYGGRGSYPGQPVKRGAGGTGGHRTNGIVPAKGPPAPVPLGTHRHAFDMNQPPVTAPRESLPSATPGPQDVDNIFKEMRMPREPVSAIAATPRIDTDNKYQYNPLVKMPEPIAPLIKKRERPTTSRLPSTDLHNGLDLSEDSDDETKKNHHILSVDKMLSPIHQTPAPHQSSKYCASERIPTFAPVEPVAVPPEPPVLATAELKEGSGASSSSDSGSDSGESDDSDSSSEDSVEEQVTSQVTGAASPCAPPPPIPELQETAAQSPHRNDEQENRTRWNLASFVNNQTETIKSQGSPTTSPAKSGAVLRASPDSRKRPAESDSDSEDSCSDIDKALADVKQLVAYVKRPIVSWSDSDNKSDDAVSRKKKRQRSHRVPPQSRARLSESDDSDSDHPAERSSPSKIAPKPVVRPSPRTKSAGSASDSDTDHLPPPSAKMPTALSKVAPSVVAAVAPPISADLSESDSDHQPTPQQQPATGPKISPVGEPPPGVPKPKGRGRPRKIKAEGSEGETVKKQRGRPRMSREGEVKKTGKRGRPPKIRQSAPPSSSDDEAFEKTSTTVRKTKTKEEYSTDSDSPHPSPAIRRMGYKQDSDRDSVPFHASPTKRKAKTPQLSDEYKKSKPESDEECGDRKKDRLFQDSRSDRSESESSSRRKREKTKESTSPFRRKGAKTQEYKSVAFIPTSSDSDEAGSRSAARARKSSASEHHQVHRISDSESDADIGQVKLEADKNRRDGKADKNKSDTLRKLFTPKRDTEGGGKGGGKGGKGGKGKAGVNVIIVDGDSERTSSSVEDEAIPAISNTNLLSPIAANDVKPAVEHTSKVKVSSPNAIKTENVAPARCMPVSIDLNRFNINEIPKLKQHLQATKPWLLEQRGGVKGSKLKGEQPSEADAEDKPPLDSSLESRRSTTDDSKRMKKRKRKNSGSSVSSMSTVSSNISHASKKDKDKESNKHKSKRRKEEQDLSKVPQIRTQTESLTSINTPPTNHERDRLAPGLDSIIAPSTSKGSPVMRVYYSYFESMEENPERELRDQNQYLGEAQRLKKQAVKENNTINQGLLYLEAVLYFLLSGNAMEHENFNDQTPFTMYITTLSLIKYITHLTNDITSSLSIRSKLAILTYRCQALLYFKMFKMKKQECMEAQKIISDHYSKQTEQPCPGQGTPSPLSPTPSPAGSVNSVGSQSSGYSSGELTSKVGPPQQSGMTAAGGVWIPTHVNNAMIKLNQHYSNLLNYQQMWETADDAVINGRHTEFFIELDRYCKPLTMHSSLIELVRYVQEGIKRLKREAHEAASNYN